ncbi:bacterial proteasome activator family protein [Actinomycetospora straminea]|uniref:Bacterial proteasome activator n=1 Tax=Actinomycetospora straminea TaxID=663607 RepID=A0ABP9E3N9_9PSEU|nr:bacterial proteasome activator family protein [Actinomycetospora straminea]MDD7934609.1 bacterial proteasome activator family protein [Actinomycetospora straminea]
MSEAPGNRPSAPTPGDQVMIVGPDGQPVGTVRVPDDGQEPEAQAVDGTPAPAERREDLSEAVEEPAKVMRIGMMIKQLLEEVRETDLDDASRGRLREIQTSSLRELESALAPELREELGRLIEPFSAEEAPTAGELRIAQAQLVGWLEGLFHGIQTALVAQQMAAKVQLEQMRRGLPAGSGASAGGGQATGQYL